MSRNDVSVSALAYYRRESMPKKPVIKNANDFGLDEDKVTAATSLFEKGVLSRLKYQESLD